MTLLFFNLGGGEIIMVILIVLLLFGSKKIPELARALGKGMNEFKRATGEIQKELTDTAFTKEAREIEKEVKEIRKSVEDKLL